jgi:DeoR/GlpR family transcriptional regulator of sugar metabolism
MVNKKPLYTEQRRKFIRERLESQGRATFKDICENFEGTNRGSIHADIASLRRVGIEVQIEGKKSERQIVSTYRPNIVVKDYRKGVNKEKKDEIARLAAGIIIGPRSGARWKKVNPDKESDLTPRESEKHFPSKEQILKHLAREAGEEGSEGKNDKSVKSPKQEAFSSLIKRLELYWGNQQRCIAIDTGTTTEAIIDKIKDIEIPSKDISHFHLFTNSRGIFEVTGRHDCSIKTVIIGGLQHKGTEAICGILSRLCIDAWNPNFGVSIVGATTISKNQDNDYILGSFSDAESHMKSALLARGAIRIVVADSLKFHQISLGVISPFGILSRNLVDLVITDAPLSNDPVENEAIMKNFPVPLIYAKKILEQLSEIKTS